MGGADSVSTLGHGKVKKDSKKQVAEICQL